MEGRTKTTNHTNSREEIRRLSRQNPIRQRRIIQEGSFIQWHSFYQPIQSPYSRISLSALLSSSKPTPQLSYLNVASIIFLELGIARIELCHVYFVVSYVFAYSPCCRPPSSQRLQTMAATTPATGLFSGFINACTFRKHYHRHHSHTHTHTHQARVYSWHLTQQILHPPTSCSCGSIPTRSSIVMCGSHRPLIGLLIALGFTFSPSYSVRLLILALAGWLAGELVGCWMAGELIGLSGLVWVCVQIRSIVLLLHNINYLMSYRSGPSWTKWFGSPPLTTRSLMWKASGDS